MQDSATVQGDGQRFLEGNVLLYLRGRHWPTGEMNIHSCYGIIPARYDSSRFREKTACRYLWTPMFWHVYAHTERASVLRNIVLATDDRHIATPLNGNPHRRHDPPRPRQRNGSGFEAAAAARRPSPAVSMNIQGDEPALDHRHQRAAQ